MSPPSSIPQQPIGGGRLTRGRFLRVERAVRGGCDKSAAAALVLVRLPRDDRIAFVSANDGRSLAREIALADKNPPLLPVTASVSFVVGCPVERLQLVAANLVLAFVSLSVCVVRADRAW